MKATEEQIKARAFEIMSKTTPDLAEQARGEAEEEFKKKVKLTDNQRHILKNKIARLTEATGHHYHSIMFIKHKDIINTDKMVRLLYSDTTGGHSDEIHGTFVSFIDDVFEWNKLYELEDLWEDDALKKVWKAVENWEIEGDLF